MDPIYPPSEDTFLLVDALIKDKAFMQWYFQPLPWLVVEVGVGSGTVITQVSLEYGDNNEILYLATDIQSHALHSFRATYHLFDLLQSDLLTWLHPTDHWMCIFNPPYVATDEEEYIRGQTEQTDLATWAGGIRGRQVIDRFCQQLCVSSETCNWDSSHGCL